MIGYNVDENGYYGEFGGTYVPESLTESIEALKKSYLNIIESEEFQTEFRYLLKHYVGRPSPLYEAPNMSRKYGARIFLKREDLNFTGAHKINNALGQILLAKHFGKKRIICETGAGQHGVATATVCALMNMPCRVYMGETDIKRQHPNVRRMQMLGAEVYPVKNGTMTLNDAVDAALEDWSKSPDDTFYIIGSAVGPHPYPDIVSRLQSIISEEIKQQLDEQIGRNYPDYVIACVGGGSNATGAFYHFVQEKRTRLILAEAGGKGYDTKQTAATVHSGTTDVLHGSKTLVLHDEGGNIAEAYSLSAGLDYPGIGPALANLAKTGRAEVYSINDDEALKAAFELTHLEGIIPALESSHALAVLPKMKLKKEDVVVVNVSGRGDKDLETYLENPVEE